MVKAYESKDINLEGIEKIEDNQYIYIELFINDNLVSDNYYQEKRDKFLSYPHSNIKVEQLDKNLIKISADKFTKGIYIVSDDNVLSENFFNLNASEEKIIMSSNEIDISNTKVICLNNIYKEK